MKKRYIVCSTNKKQETKQIIKKMKEKEKRPKVNLILSHVNSTFLILTLKLDPKPLDTLIVP